MPTRIEDGVYRTNVARRHRAGNRMRAFYISSIILAFVVLIALLANITNQAIGLTVVDYVVNPSELADAPLEELSVEELGAIITERIGGLTLRLVYDNLSPLSEMRAMSGVPLSESIKGAIIPDGWGERPVNDLSVEERAELLVLNLDKDDLLDIIDANIVQSQVVEVWNLDESIFNRDEINAIVADEYSHAELKWRSWVTFDFLGNQLDSVNAAASGISPALWGTLWLMALVALIAFPLGVGAAIYLEEYADDSFFNQMIETNIRNLASVPSIIYGLLGLAIFVRALAPLTSGEIFGFDGGNGRTILSAAFTLALLILPIIIISTQEALRAVPSAIREASYGLGATKWQTISRQVLPSAMPGIMTGTIIALSRAVGETAPLIVVGAATFIGADPDGPFSSFTALPILIYNWVDRPEAEFSHAAAAAILVLLAVLLTMNSVAVIIRNRTSRR